MRRIAVLFATLIALPACAAENAFVFKDPEWLVTMSQGPLTAEQQAKLRRHNDLVRTLDAHVKSFPNMYFHVESLLTILEIHRKIAIAQLDLAPAAEKAGCMADFLANAQELHGVLRKQYEEGLARQTTFQQAERTRVLNAMMVREEAAKAPEVKQPKEPAWLAKLRTEKLDEVRSLQLKRHDKLALSAVEQEKYINAGSWDVNSLFNVFALKRQMAEARLELAPAGERVAALDDILAHARDLEQMLRKRVNAGAERPTALYQAEAATLEIEIMIAKEKKAAAK